LLALHICALSCANTLVILGDVGDADGCDCCPYAILDEKTVTNKNNTAINAGPWNIYFHGE